MKYSLMHKNICIVDVDIDPKNGRIIMLGDVYEKAHLPVGVFFYLTHTISDSVLDIFNKMCYTDHCEGRLPFLSS